MATVGSTCAADLLKILASLVVVSTGGAVGREGAMILLSAMAASWIGRPARHWNLRLMVSCGRRRDWRRFITRPGRWPVFAAEILLGSLVWRSRAGRGGGGGVARHHHRVGWSWYPISHGNRSHAWSVASHGHAGVRADQQRNRGRCLCCIGWNWASVVYQALPCLYRCHWCWRSGGRVLSLWRPEVWGNGDSGVRQQIDGLRPWQTVALVLGLLLAVAATTGSGAPGGVFTPTLFVGAAFGAARPRWPRAGYTGAAEPVYAVLGCITLAGTTHAPVMACVDGGRDDRPIQLVRRIPAGICVVTTRFPSVCIRDRFTVCAPRPKNPSRDRDHQRA